MNLRIRELFAPRMRWLVGMPLFASFLVGDALAQGLSGVPRRVEETVPGATPGGGPPAGYGSGYGNQTGYPEGQDPSAQAMEASNQGNQGYGSGYGSQTGYPEGQEPMSEPEPTGGYGDGYGGDGYGGGAPEARGGDFGSPSGFGGGPTGRRPGRGPTSPAEMMLGSTFGPLGELNLAALLGPRQEEAELETGPVLKTEAEQAFATGNYALARELAFAHMAAEYPQSIVDVQTVKYSPMLRRPVWNIRFGVSMAVRGGVGITDPQPIRESASGRRIAQAGPRGRGASGGGGGLQQQMEPDMAEMEMMGAGSEGMEEMQEPPNMADFGDPNAMAPPTRRTRAVESAPARSMLDAGTREELGNHLGLVAEVVGEGFKKRFQAGDFGPILTGVSAPEPVEPVRGGLGGPAAPAPMAGGSMSAMLSETMDSVGDPLPMWVPGIAYVGRGTWEEIVPVARAAKLDLVLHFDVVLKKGRTDQVQNICRCRIMHVGSGKTVAVSKGMDSREASQLASSGRTGERDYVDEKLASLWTVMDSKVKTIDLPRLSAPVAKKRVASLLGGSTAQSLRTLAEIRLYQAQELITEEEVETAFDIVGGPEALTMLYGPSNERAAMARKWAIRAQGGQVDN